MSSSSPSDVEIQTPMFVSDEGVPSTSSPVPDLSSNPDDSSNEVPVSPSSLPVQDIQTPTPSSFKPKDPPPPTIGKEIKRKPNSEFTNPFLCNLFYCFYFQFVCKCSYIADEDIFDVHPRNATDRVTKIAEEHWQKRYAEYLLELAQYDKEKSENPQYAFAIIIFII